jgi:DNA-binding NarL/FixJ family response regulator
MPITVCLIEDDRATRTALVNLLGNAEGISCTGSYSSGEEALRGIPGGMPDVVLVDIHLSGMSGIDCVTRLKARFPRLHILMITTCEDRDLIFRSLRAGASGYLLKSTPKGELIQAIQQIHEGGAPMSMQVARKVVDHFHEIRPSVPEVGTLTPREHEILALLAQGFLYKEIGDKLNISLNTVKTHLHVIYEKLHVQSRTEATARFLGHH